MACFTSGERRGLIILACILTVIVCVLGIRELWWRFSAAESDVVSVIGVSDDSASGAPADSTDTGCSTDSLRLEDRVSGASSGPTERKAGKKAGKANGKKKKEQGRGKDLPPPRRPLDEPVN